MVNRFFASLIVIVLVIGAVVFFGLRTLKNHADRNAAVQSQKKQDIAVTIIEGKRREEIAAQLDKAGVTQYADFLSASAGKEGHLFPDTYRFFPNTPASTVVDTLISDYQTRVKDLQPSKDQLILASIVEREALNTADRAVIAGVYQNRLDQGMTLGSDPTVQYAKDTLSYQAGTDPKNFSFWKEITQADYQNVTSTFNTYLQTGLPPAPICNPGLESIEAAMNPTQHSYLYFIYKHDKLLLSRTLDEHNAQVAAP